MSNYQEDKVRAIAAGWTEDEAKYGLRPKYQEKLDRALAAGWSEKDAKQGLGLPYLPQEEVDRAAAPIIENFPALAEKRFPAPAALEPGEIEASDPIQTNVIGFHSNPYIAPKDRPFTEADGTLDLFQAGMQASAGGMMLQQSGPRKIVPETAETWEKYISGLTTLAMDLPFYTFFAAAGTAAGAPTGIGAPIVGGATSFAGVAGLKEVLMDTYENGQIETWTEFWDRLSKTVLASSKGALEGAVVSATAGVGKPLIAAASTTAGRLGTRSLMTAVESAELLKLGDILYGQFGGFEQFGLTAATLGTLKLATGAAQARANYAAKQQTVSDAATLRQIFRETGRNPEQVLRDIQNDPSILYELAAQEGGIPRSYRPASTVTDKGVPEAPVLKPRVMDPSTLDDGTYGVRKVEVVGAKGAKKAAWETFAVADESADGSGMLGSFKTRKAAVANVVSMQAKAHGVAIAQQAKTAQATPPSQPPPNLPAASTPESRAFDNIMGRIADRRVKGNEYDFNKWMVQWWDRRYALQTVTRKGAGARAQLGIDLMPPELNPDLVSRVFSGISAKSASAIKYGYEEVNSSARVKGIRSFDSVLIDVNELKPMRSGDGSKMDAASSADQFRAFLVARRAIELNDRTRGQVKLFGPNQTVLDINDMRSLVAKMGTKYEALAKQFNKFAGHGPKRLLDAEIIDRDQYDLIMEDAESYIPARRDMGGDGTGGRLTGGKNPTVPYKKIRGNGELDILDPFDSVRTDVHTHMEIIERQKMYDTFYKFTREFGLEEYMIEETPKKIPTVVSPEERARLIKKVAKNNNLTQDEIDTLDLIKSEAFTVFRDQRLMAGKNQIVRYEKDAKTGKVKRKLYRVPPEIFEAFENLEPRMLDTALHWLNPLSWAKVPTTVMRTGTIASLQFAETNIVRDVLSQFVQAGKGGPIGLAKMLNNMAYGLYAVAGKGELYQEFWSSGAAQATLVDMAKTYDPVVMDAIKSTQLLRQTTNVILTPIHAMKALVQLGEEANRISAQTLAPGGRGPIPPLVREEMMRDLRALGTVKVGALMREIPSLPADVVRAIAGRNLSAAVPGGVRHTMRNRPRIERDPLDRGEQQLGALAARDASVDFQRKGTYSAIVSQYAAFFSPQMGGTLRMVENFERWGRDPKSGAKAALSAISVITIPSVALYLMNRDEEGYDGLAGWITNFSLPFPTKALDRDGNLIMVERPEKLDRNGEWVSGGINPNTGEQEYWAVNNWHKIPGPFSYQLLFGALPVEMAKSILDKDPTAFDGFLGGLWDGVSVTLIPQIIAPAVNQMADEIYWSGSPLRGPTLSGIEPELQVKPWTTELTKTIGSFLRTMPFFNQTGTLANAQTSPIIIDDILRNWTGRTGMDVLQYTSEALGRAGIIPPTYKPADTLSDHPAWRAFQIRTPTPSTNALRTFYSKYENALIRQRSIQFAITSQDEDLIEELHDRYDDKTNSALEYQRVAESLAVMAHEARQLYSVPPEGETDQDGNQLSSLAWEMEKRTQIDIIFREMNYIAQEAANEMYLDELQWDKEKNEDEDGFSLDDNTEEVIEPDGADAGASLDPDKDLEIVSFESSQFRSDKPILINRDFDTSLQRVNEIAKSHGVELFVTSATRDARSAVRNAIVSPAKKSNHHIGHAIDMNPILNGEIYTSAMMSGDNFNRLPDAVKGFLNDVADDPGLRWGGRFKTPDVVHIDDNTSEKS